MPAAPFAAGVYLEELRLTTVNRAGEITFVVDPVDIHKVRARARDEFAWRLADSSAALFPPTLSCLHCSGSARTCSRTPSRPCRMR